MISTLNVQHIESIADGLMVVATNEAYRSRLQSLGLARAAELTWSTIARRHVEVWHEAGGLRPGRRRG